MAPPAREETALRPVCRYTGAWRPKGNPPAAGGQVHGPFAPEKKPACGRWAGTWAPERKPAHGRWAGTRALRARKETGLRPVGRYTGASRPKRNRPAAGSV